MLRTIVIAMTLLPTLGWACTNGSRATCEHRIAKVVELRTQAMSRAFGDLSPVLPEHIPVRFMQSSSEEYKRFSGDMGYDREQHTLFFPPRYTNSAVPSSSQQVLDYWAFYRDEDLRQNFPLVQKIDAAIWDAFLQEAANQRGLSWPHEDCQSTDSSRRFPCEMMLVAATEYVNRAQQRIFNTNRLELIWPEDYSTFCTKLWRSDGHEVTGVRLYGGILLLRPLVTKFGIPRALAYMAQTPFRVENNNMHMSALQYQERALQEGLYSAAD